MLENGATGKSSAYRLNVSVLPAANKRSALDSRQRPPKWVFQCLLPPIVKIWDRHVKGLDPISDVPCEDRLDVWKRRKCVLPSLRAWLALMIVRSGSSACVN